MDGKGAGGWMDGCSAPTYHWYFTSAGVPRIEIGQGSFTGSIDGC